MRVDFYQLSRDPPDAVVAGLAEQTLKAGERLLVVTADAEQAGRLSQTLWTQRAESFLAHGVDGAGDEARQPILIADRVEAANGARFVVFADGVWREAGGFERAFLLFGEATIAAARAQWKALDAGERHFWRQQGGRWSEVG
jgi:DNA polymerase-3 subunit chi